MISYSHQIYSWRCNTLYLCIIIKFLVISSWRIVAWSAFYKWIMESGTKGVTRCSTNEVHISSRGVMSPDPWQWRTWHMPATWSGAPTEPIRLLYVSNMATRRYISLIKKLRYYKALRGCETHRACHDCIIMCAIKLVRPSGTTVRGYYSAVFAPTGGTFVCDSLRRRLPATRD